MVRRRVIVSGHVQGVFFRDTARRTAEAHQVSGWARNRADGSLEAVFEGDPDAVEALVEFSRNGPSGAEVSGVEVIEEPMEGLEGFRIS